METKSSNDNTTSSPLFVTIFIMDTICYSDLDAHLLYQMSASKIVFFHFINATYKSGFRTPFFPRSTNPTSDSDGQMSNVTNFTSGRFSYSRERCSARIGSDYRILHIIRSDFPVGFRCNSVTRNPIGFCRIIGSAKNPKPDPMSDWSTWAVRDLKYSKEHRSLCWIWKLNLYWHIKNTLIQLVYIIFVWNYFLFNIQFYIQIEERSKWKRKYEHLYLRWVKKESISVQKFQEEKIRFV